MCVSVTVAVNACVSMSPHVSRVKALDECLTVSQHRSPQVPRSVSCPEPGQRCLCVSASLRASLRVAAPASAPPSLPLSGSSPAPRRWVILARGDPSGHRSARPPDSLRPRGCLRARADTCFGLYLDACSGERAPARVPTCSWAPGPCPRAGALAVSPHPPWTLTFFPFRPGLPSSPGFPCGNRSSVRRQG